jgi:hypothetical protein
LARIILSHALLESIRFVMSRKECRDIYGLINIPSDYVLVGWRGDKMRGRHRRPVSTGVFTEKNCKNFCARLHGGKRGNPLESSELERCVNGQGVRHQD